MGSVGSDTNDPGDFRYWSADLYKTRRGNFILEGGGGPMSLFSVAVGDMRGSSDGIVAIGPDEALEFASVTFKAETIEEHFGEMVEDA